MAKRKVGGISTAGWIGIAAAAGVGIYLITRPKQTTTVFVPTGSGGYNNSGNSTSSIIQASGGAFSDIWGSIFGNP